MSNIDFLTTDMIRFLSHAKMTFSQWGATDLQKEVHVFQTLWHYKLDLISFWHGPWLNIVISQDSGRKFVRFLTKVKNF